MTNKAEAVAALVGSHTATYQGNQHTGNNAALAALLGRHPSMVTRFVKSGTVPARYNSALMAWAKEKGIAEAMAVNLEQICQCCGQRLTLD